MLILVDRFLRETVAKFHWISHRIFCTTRRICLPVPSEAFSSRIALLFPTVFLAKKLLVRSLLLVVRPRAPSSFLFLPNAASRRNTDSEHRAERIRSVLRGRSAAVGPRGRVRKTTTRKSYVLRDIFRQQNTKETRPKTVTNSSVS